MRLRIINQGPLSVRSFNFIKLCVLFCLAAKANPDCAHTEKQTHTSPEYPALSPSLSARPGRQITFQDGLGYTSGPVRAWHTYRKEPAPVSSLSLWLILKEVLNISSTLPSVLLDTQALRVTQQQATFLDYQAASTDYYYYCNPRVTR